MKITKNKIVSMVNSLRLGFPVKWEDIELDLDMAIIEINNYLSTKYPMISEVLDEFSSPEKTYSYRAGGKDNSFFPDKYFISIVIPFVATRILAKEEEFNTVYTKYLTDYQDNLFTMVRDEISNIPCEFLNIPKGVFFPNPDPLFKHNEEEYFNRKIKLDTPKIRITYNWGDIKSRLPEYTEVFVEKPLPKDDTYYESGEMFMPVFVSGNNYNTYIVDMNKKVLGVFLGWSLYNENDENKIIIDPIKLENRDLTFYAVFDYKVIGITYRGNGGTIHNWQPTYVTRKDESQNGIIPYGGTASRAGFRFIGFNPERIEFQNIEEISNDSKTMELFAEWYRLIYSIRYEGVKNTEDFNPERFLYEMGDEFRLPIPTSTPAFPDEFIGWFDNIHYEGDPITHIFESDFGDKTFYAKYNEERYKITFMNSYSSQGAIIIEEKILTKGSIISSPLEIPIKPNSVNSQGLEFRYEFLNYIDSRGNILTEGTKANRTEIYNAQFTEGIPVTDKLIIEYKKNDNGSVSNENYVSDYQIGTIIKPQDLLDFMRLNDMGLYSEDGVTKGIIGFINENNEIIPLNQDFIFQKETRIKATYGTETININYRKKSYVSGSWVVDSTNIQKTFSLNELGNVPRRSIETTGSSITEIEFEINVDGNKYYLNGFRIFKDGIESVVPENLTSINDNEILVPFYSTTINENFVCKLTIRDFPRIEDNNLTYVESLHRIGETVIFENLQSIQNTKNDQLYKYNQVDRIYSDVEKTKIETSVTLTKNITFYAGISSKKIFDLKFDTSNNIVKTYYRGDVPVEGIEINASSFGIVPLKQTGLSFVGWNKLPNQNFKDEIITLTKEESNNVPGKIINFYGAYLELKGFVIRVNYRYLKNNQEIIPTPFLEETEIIRLNYSREKENFILFDSLNNSSQKSFYTFTTNKGLDMGIVKTISGIYTNYNPFRMVQNYMYFEVNGVRKNDSPISFILPEAKPYEQTINVTIVTNHSDDRLINLDRRYYIKSYSGFISVSNDRIGEEELGNNEVSIPESFYYGSGAFENKHSFFTRYNFSIENLMDLGALPKIYNYGTSSNQLYYAVKNSNGTYRTLNKTTKLNSDDNIVLIYVRP